MQSLKPTYLRRYAQLVGMLIKYGREDLVDDCGIRPDDDCATVEAGNGKPADLATDLEEMGPTFVKLGQLLSTRSDLLPQAYLDALTRLQDDVEPVDVDELREVIESELGVRISNAFESFDERPIAAASLGQVHRARLRSGQDVAVKVLRPGIREQVADDLAAIRHLAKALDKHTEFARKYGFLSIADSLEQTMSRELDLRKEAQHARRLSENLDEFDRFVVPTPIDDYCSADVLTMEYVSGTKITDLSPAVLIEADRHGLADELFRAYLKQVLIDGFFHADPHPGNLLFTRDHRIAMLDCGMVVHFNPSTRSRMLKLLLAISEGRGEDAARAARSLGDPIGTHDTREFEARISRIVMEHQHLPVEQMQAGRTLMAIQCAAGETGLRLHNEVTLLGKTLLNLDRVVTRLDPSFDPNAALRAQATSIMERHSTSDFSLGRVFHSVLETTDLVQNLPERLNKISRMAAENRLRVEVDAIDEDRLVNGLQKIANRVTVGLLLAALIIGASLMMRMQAEWTLFGYPGIAMIFFLLAAIASLFLVARIALADGSRESTERTAR